MQDLDYKQKTLMSGYFGFFSFRHSETSSFFVWLYLAELVATWFCYVKSAAPPRAVLALCRTVEMPLTPQVIHLLSRVRIKQNYRGFSLCFFDPTPRQHESSLWWVITVIDAHTILLCYWTWLALFVCFQASEGEGISSSTQMSNQI